MTGRELRRLRRRLGWTQAEMAKALGFEHRNTIQKLESGVYPVSKAVALAVRCLALHGRR